MFTEKQIESFKKNFSKETFEQIMQTDKAGKELSEKHKKETKICNLKVMYVDCGNLRKWSQEQLNLAADVDLILTYDGYIIKNRYGNITQPGCLKEKITSHICKQATHCICSSINLEPDETCPIHGSGEFPPRCENCGQFIKWKK